MPTYGTDDHVRADLQVPDDLIPIISTVAAWTLAAKAKQPELTGTKSSSCDVRHHRHAFRGAAGGKKGRITGTPGKWRRSSRRNRRC